MFYNHTIKIAFIISLLSHIMVLGIPLNFSKLINLQVDTPGDITIQIEIEKLHLLPKIDTMGDEKKLKEVVKKTKPLPNTEKEEIEPQSFTEEPIEVINPSREAMLRYQDIIKQRIEEKRWYPEWAKDRKYQGTVQLRFTVFSNGDLGDIQVLHSSAYECLNHSAVETIKKASPFPPIPEEITESSVNIEVSIVYLLKN